MTFIFLTQIQEANLPYLFLQSVQQYAVPGQRIGSAGLTDDRGKQRGCMIFEKKPVSLAQFVRQVRERFTVRFIVSSQSTLRVESIKCANCIPLHGKI